MNFEDFFSYYPTLESKELTKEIKAKREFYNYKVGVKHNYTGHLAPQNHQVLVSRLLSDKTLSDECLILHDMGTGKSITALLTIEEIINSPSSSIKKGLLLVRNDDAIASYIRELVEKVNSDKYKPEDYDILPPKTKTTRVSAKIKDYYELNSHGSFANYIDTLSDETIINNYSNRIIIIDEVQFLRLPDTESGAGGKRDDKKYEKIKRFLNLVKNCKVLLMSGTPMRDTPDEIINILNLILAKNRQLPDNFDLSKIKEYSKGIVSFLKYPPSSVKKVFVGKKYDFFTLFEDYMDKHQADGYKKALDQDIIKGSKLYPQSQQASAFVFPDGSYGKEGFAKYTPKISNKLLKEALKGKDDTQTLDNIKRCSSKYYSVIKNIIDNPTFNTFVYNEFVVGSGCIVLGRLLELFGYTRLDHTSALDSIPAGKRYVIIATEIGLTKTHRAKIRNLFNSAKNYKGDFLQVIIGSRTISTAINLFNVRQMSVVTPYWNYTDIDQAIARIFRYKSHDVLIKQLGLKKEEDLSVNVYQHCSITPPGIRNIDLDLYTISQTKDKAIRTVTRALKESAIDCSLNYDINFQGVDYSRECDYSTCSYKCDGFDTVEQMMEKPVIDDLTYKLFYTIDEEQNIITKIRELYRREFYYTISDFNKLLKEYTPYIILITLKKLIDNSETIINKYGSPNYIKEKDDIFFLSNTLLPSYGFTDSYYVKYPEIEQVLTLNELTEKYTHSYSASVFDTINKLKPGDYDVYLPLLFDKLPPIFVQKGLELALSNSKAKNEALSKWLKEKYAAYWYKIEEENMIVIRYAEPFTCYKKGKWESCSIEDLEKVYIKKKETKLELKNSPYGFYGVHNPHTGQFWISMVALVKGLSTIGVDDSRRVFQGRICSTFDKAFSAMLAFKLGVLPSKKTGEFKNHYLSALHKLKRELTLEQANEALKFDVDKLSPADEIYLKGLMGYSKPDLCDLIFKRLKALENELGIPLVGLTDIKGKLEQS